MKIPDNFSFSGISPTVRFLSTSDAILTAALGLFGPIFAIFIAEKIQVENPLEVIGIGAAIYLFTRSLGQIPLAYFIDKIRGERDDFLVLLTGNTVYIIVPLLYLFIDQPWHLFAIQFIYGLGGALVYPSWNAIFTRHIDKGKEGMEWGIYQTMCDLAGAAAAPIGGIVASTYGFNFLMYIASAMAVVSSIYIFLIKDDLRKK